ncbi:MAG: hypothetical protein K9J17_07960 [Flavobacteriales bacterium]|nr:hypothetical protein [Flavobacteriales bacterium]
MKSICIQLILIVAVVTLTKVESFAQNELDALRYSQVDVLGTARYSAMGGAFGALGGDMSSMGVNPAGIGVFTKSTGSATISILSAGTDATYLGTSSSDNKVNLNISNVGFVARFKRKRGDDKQWAWKAFHLGVTYNRTANFNRRTSIVGVNTSSSAIDPWVDQLNNSGIQYADIPTNDFVPSSGLTNAYMGWGTFLIDTTPGSVNSYLRNVLPNYGQSQQVKEMTKGSMGEVAITFGGNFGNALYIGGSIGIPRINYELERGYTESDTQDSIADFDSFTKTDYLKASGTGFNFKLGMIYRPVKWLRLGASVHTPSYFNINEQYKSLIVANAFGTTFSQSTLQGAFKYNLQTPFRAIGSLGFVVGKIGLISADYEYVNYSLAHFRSRSYGFDVENTNVQSRLHWAGNIRIGTEWRINSFSVRGGFGINGDPFTGKFNFDNTRYSVGAGFRLDHFFVDLAYSLHRTVSSYEVYDVAYVPLAKTVTIDNSIIATVGFRF